MINHVVILGRLTKTPMLQTTNSGKKSTFISIATTTYNVHMKRNKTNYVSIKLWGQTAEYVVKKGKKGMEVSVEGILKTSSYVNEQDKQVFVTEVVAENVHLITSQFDETAQNVSNSNASEFEKFVNALQ
ncbi:single-stranded DNA-binding protein [Gottfriedia solisilvae]|uniref:Single-stranded DNA-binding protein n=1 Tax=Gottfriedia solisilvae TaxID=1516104 RepID=A0A8J3AFS0_9BACI|nr:single-stranded DNA-binding protein [Gottfriedia solisilvae]GGI12443.1 single-stranded DNA-binding protein 3 [Gottfriedia solisilvae]